MKQLLLIACLIGTPTFANEWRCDANGGCMYQSSRVVELPADQNKTYCTVIGNPTDPQYRQLCTWFDQNPSLAELKAKTHFHTLDSNSTIYKARYATTVDQLPCVRIQKANGETICQVSGSNIPLTSDAMVNCLNATLRRHNAEPQPNLHFHYTVAPDEPEPKPQPDVFTNSNAMQGKWWMLAIAGVASTFAGVAWQWKKSYEE
jgi:hypothetical protein